MIFKILVWSVTGARLWVATGLATGLIAGLIAAFFFNPYIVTYHIKNNNGYFDIANFKTAKLDLVDMTRNLLIKFTDPVRAKKLEETLGNSEWSEANITPTFSVTKTDVRDLVESQKNNNLFNNQNISYINMKINSEHPYQELPYLKFAFRSLINSAQKARLYAWLKEVQTNQEQTLTEILIQLFNISLIYASNKDRIEVIKNIISTDPAASKNTQFNILMGREQANNNQAASDLTAFLSPDQQLAGLQINQAYLAAKLRELRFKQEVSEYLIERALDGQDAVKQLGQSADVDGIDLSVNLWRQGKMLETLNKEESWNQEYLESEFKSLEIKQKQLSLAYQDIANLSGYMEYKRKFSKLLAITAGLLAGLMASLIAFVLIQIKKLEKWPSDKA